MSAPVEEAAPAPRPPDVTVVVTGGNPAAASAAAASVLDQTLAAIECVVVTDARAPAPAVPPGATPGSVRVVAAVDARAARDVGIGEARAGWVMFLDAGDELERHAAKNLLLAGEAADADVVAGVCTRVDPARPAVRAARFPESYADRNVVDGVAGAPDLLADTRCTGKLYRRAFLESAEVGFTGGPHDTELLFTTKAWCAARRIALLPVEVYRWHAGDEDETNARGGRPGDLDGFRTRMATLRLVDDRLASSGQGELRAITGRRFLLHDLPVHLGDLRRRDPDYRERWAAMASEQLASLPVESFTSVGVVPRAAAYLVQHGDLDAALDVADLWLRGYFGGDLDLRGGRAYLHSSAPHDAALDVTSLHLHDAPFSRRRLTNRLLSMSVDSAGVVLHGEVNNLLGLVTADDDPALSLVLRSRDGRRRQTLGTTTVQVTPRRLQWHTTVRPTPGVRPDPAAVWDLWTEIAVGSATSLVRMTAVPGAVSFVPVPLTDATGAQPLLRLRTSADGDVVGRVEHPGRSAAPSARLAARLRRSAVGRTARRVRRLTGTRRMKALAYRTVFARLPLRGDTVVFESMLGRSYSDSPKYVFEELRRSGPMRRVVWSYDGDPRQWPGEVTLVRRDSWRYYYELARAGTWVDNQGFPPIARPRSGTAYLQTWHGSPYKAMGFDQPELQLGPARRRQEFSEQVARWTYFCVQSEFAEERFDHAFRHRAENLRIGYPRNDPLLSGHDATASAALRRRLGLPADRRLVLYAPTFRDYRRTTREPYRLPFDLARVGEAVGNDCFLMIRPHYLDHLVVPPRFADVAADVSGHHDVTELLLLADCLVTDYSSTMFDYALLRRPMVFFAYDLELYTTSRGVYFDLVADAPGPVVTTEAELVNWLADPDSAHDRHAARYQRFLERFCTYETGQAAAGAVARVFGAAS